MKDSERLTYVPEKSGSNLDELWKNCFEGDGNMQHMTAYEPYPVNSQWELNSFLIHEMGYKTWLIKRKIEGDIIGFAVHGDYFRGLPNNIGFNIGLNYTRNGYARETLASLLEHLKESGYTETFGHCFAANIASVRTMEACGFENMGPTGKVYNGNMELEFRNII